MQKRQGWDEGNTRTGRLHASPRVISCAIYARHMSPVLSAKVPEREVRIIRRAEMHTQMVEYNLRRLQCR
jgi:hypothetical protein